MEMGRHADIDRALADAVELRLLASKVTDPSVRTRLAHLARRRAADIGPSVPKTRAAKAFGVTVAALDRWVVRGALKTRRSHSSREEIDTESVVELAVEIRSLAESGRRRGLLAEALARREAAQARGTAMGTGGFFPDQAAERREELETLTPGERVAQAIEVSRAVTKIAAAGVRSRAGGGAS
jgi:hypothetical protein